MKKPDENMRLKLIEGDQPSRELTDEDQPHYDNEFVYIPLWCVYLLSEENHVSKKSAFWHILNHEILHIKKKHGPYTGPNPHRCWQDVQRWANSYRRTQLEAMPDPIDNEIRILNEDMRQRIKREIQRYNDRFRIEMQKRMQRTRLR